MMHCTTTFKGAAALVGMAASLALMTTGCRGDDISNDCELQGQAYIQTAQNEATPLLAPVPNRSPFPVTLELTEDGINRLLGGAVADQDVPFTGNLPLGPANADFRPESDPVIEFVDLPGCNSCILFSLQFGINLATGNSPISSGVGNVSLSIPMRLDSDEEAGVSTLVADYSRAEVRDLQLVVYGINSEEHATLTGALKILLTERVQESFDEVELLQIGSWQIGQGDVRLIARRLIVRPEDDKLILGMQTNLPLAADVGIDLEGELPPGSPMAVKMDTRLFLTMSHRMFEEGEIARRYDEDGNPDDDGLFAVTLSDMVGNEMNSPQLDSTFRVWRTAEGYCGFAEAVMPLNVEVNSTNTGINITPGTATVIDGEGYGQGALQDPELVDNNQHLVDNFRSDLADAIGTTVNYDALDLDGSTIVFAVQDVAVDPLSVNSYLDFIVVQDATDE